MPTMREKQPPMKKNLKREMRNIWFIIWLEIEVMSLSNGGRIQGIVPTCSMVLKSQLYTLNPLLEKSKCGAAFLVIDKRGTHLKTGAGYARLRLWLPRVKLVASH